MSCEHVRDLLSAYLDNQLAGVECQNVASHLAHCLDCNAVLADYRHFDTLVARLPRVTAPDWLASSLFSSEEYQQLQIDNKYATVASTMSGAGARFSNWSPLPIAQMSARKCASQHSSPYLSPIPLPKVSLPRCLNTLFISPGALRRSKISNRYVLIALAIISLLLINKYLKRYVVRQRLARTKPTSVRSSIHS